MLIPPQLITLTLPYPAVRLRRAGSIPTSADEEPITLLNQASRSHVPKKLFPQWLGTGNADHLLLKAHTSVYPRKEHPAHLLSLYGTAPHLPTFGSGVDAAPKRTVGTPAKGARVHCTEVHHHLLILHTAPA